MLACQECEKATGTGYFADKGAHDRHVKNPWNDHTLTDADVVTDKAAWMLSCPVCKDAAALRTKGGIETRHLTVGVNDAGDEIVRCSACGKLYRFNLQWTFEKKELPPKVKEQWLPKRVFLVRAEPQADEVEVYASERGANERIRELEGDVLEAAGYTQIDDEWQSPFGTRLDHDQAVQEAMDENAGDMPEAPEEVDLLD